MERLRQRLAALSFPHWFVLPAPFVLLAPVLLPGRAMFWGLPMLQFVPWWTQAWRTLLAGQLPLWNPLVGLGAPLLANYQTALLYPPTWSLAPFAALGGAGGIAYGLGWLTALHLLWAGLGTLRLARALGWRELPQTITALAFMLGGFLAARQTFPSIIFAAVWLPWLLWAALRYARILSRRDLLLLAAFTALQLLAGHAQTSWYSIQLVAAWLALWAALRHGWRGWLRAWGGYALAGAFALALSAAQLLPTAEYLLLSQRVAAAEPELALVNSFWPLRLLGLALPGLFGSPVWGDFWGYATYWEDALFLSVPALLLVGFALLRRGKARDERALLWFTLIVSGLAFTLALGFRSPVFMWLYEHVPTFAMFKSPTRYMLWLAMLLPLLAGQGAQFLRRPTGRTRYWANLSLAAAAAVALGAGAFALWVQFGGIGELDYRISLFTAPALFSVSAFLFVLLWRAAPDTPGLGSTRWRALLAGLVLLDLLVAHWGLNPAIDADYYAAADAPTPAGRVYFPAEDVQALTYERFLTFEDFAIAEPWANARAALLPNLPLLDGVPMLNNFDPLLPDSYSQLIAEVEAGTVDLALLGVSAQVTADEYDRFAPVAVQLLDPPGERVYWLTDEPDATWAWLADTPNRIELTLRTSSPNTLIIADQFYPGWEARLNGQRVSIEAHQYGALRAVAVPAGVHELSMRYIPRAFYAGSSLSLVAWLGWVVLWRREQAG